MDRGAPPAVPAGEGRRLCADGTAAYRRGAWREAEMLFTRGLDSAPGDARLLCGRSAALLAAGNAEAALADAERCAERHPGWGKGHVRAAMALRHMGRYAEALLVLDRALAADPDNTELATLLSCTESDDLFSSALSRFGQLESPPRERSGSRDRPGLASPREAAQNTTRFRFAADDPLPPLSPGARRITCNDGTTFTSFFTSPTLAAAGEASGKTLAAYPSPLPSRSPGHAPLTYTHTPASSSIASPRRGQPPDPQADIMPGLTPVRVAAALVAFLVPPAIYLGASGDTTWRESCGFELPGPWVLLVAAAACWAAVLPAAAPLRTSARTTVHPPPGGPVFGVVLPVLVLLAAVAGARLAAGPSLFMGALQILDAQRCGLAVAGIAAFHLAAAAYAADALSGLQPDTLDDTGARLLSLWLSPGLLIHLALTGTGVYNWCSAIREAPTGKPFLTLPAAAEVLLCVAALAVLGTGLRKADRACTRPAPPPTSVAGLPVREWKWLALTSVLVVAFLAVKEEEDTSCTCPEPQRKWVMFGF